MLLLTKEYEFKMTIHSIESIKLADQILQTWILNRSLIFELSDSVSIGRYKSEMIRLPATWSKGG